MVVVTSLAITLSGAFGKPALRCAQKTKKYLLLDSRFVDKTVGAELALGEITRRRDNPLFKADEPWEFQLANLYPNVTYDPQAKLYKCWYSIKGKGFWEGLCYAQSTDGIVWEKPSLGMVEFQGSKDNNILFLIHQISVL